MTCESQTTESAHQGQGGAQHRQGDCIVESPFAFYEFFCGSGAVRLALGAGWQCVFANDIDAVKMRSYVSNFGSQGAITRDVADLTTADLPYGPEIGPVDLAWCSFPCQESAWPVIAPAWMGRVQARSGASGG